jgi:hypothetical protein
MFSRRIVGAVMLGVTVAVGGIAPARAATPAPAPASTESMTSPERPLTAAEQKLSQQKIDAAERYAARLRVTGFGLAPLACVPNAMPPSGAAGTASAPTPKEVCAPPSGFLSVAARQQTKNHYCGPAVGQVISNYAWAMASGKDKYTQAVIAGWMKTDLNGQTSAPELAAGLTRATGGSPRHKPGFTWGITKLEDTDRNGTTADELQTYLMSAISSAKMPMAIAVKPHDPASSIHLASWPRAVASSGHWIAAYGWTWTGGASARTYYVDSSKAQGGGTGAYWDLTTDIAKLINAHTKRIVW